MIGLVDGNNFFVSCERVFDPSLEGKPVAVLSNNDGCCISRSNEFKALKIPMGTPYFQLKPLIGRYGLILRSSNYELYGDLSRRILAVLREFAEEVEPYSIDEAFLHPALPPETDFHDFGRKIRKTILQWVGIPCGVGFAPSRTLAKIANHIGKKRPDGVFVLPSDPEPVLKETPVAEVWGVGRRLAPKLERLGIRTAADLAAADEVLLRKKFSVRLAKTIRELRGESVLEPDDPDGLSQSISCSRSFGKPVLDPEGLSESICSYTARACEKLRKEKQSAAGIHVYFQYCPEYEPLRLAGGYTAATVIFAKPTSSTAEMLQQLRPRLERCYIPGRRYRKSGAILFGLEPDRTRQPDLFDNAEECEKRERLSRTADAINRRFGRGTLFHLSEGIDRTWSMRRELLSPRRTTDWDQLLQVT